MGDERIDIVETTARMAVLADARQWAALVEIFTDQVAVDYSSHGGRGGLGSQRTSWSPGGPRPSGGWPPPSISWPTIWSPWTVTGRR